MLSINGEQVWPTFTQIIRLLSEFKTNHSL